MRWFKNKRLNTILFLIVASIMNLVIIALLLLIALFILDRFVNRIAFIGTLFWLAFLFSIGGSFYIYTFVIKSLTVRLRLEENLDPIFKQKRRYKKDRSK